MAHHHVADSMDIVEVVLPPEILEGADFGQSVEAFQIHATIPWFGLWAVANEWKNTSDLPSIKEQSSYVMLQRPYKFLQSPDKRAVDEKATDATEVHRTQVPVAWNYPLPNWTETILNRLHEATQFREEFEKRAEDAKRFTEKEIEKLEDWEMEAIVSKFFSMTELKTRVWAGISGPARIRLHHAAPPVAVRTISESFREVLELGGDEPGGIVPIQLSSPPEAAPKP